MPEPEIQRICDRSGLGEHPASSTNSGSSIATARSTTRYESSDSVDSPRLSALMTRLSCARERTPSLRYTLRRWKSIVFGLRKSAGASLAIRDSVGDEGSDLKFLRG
jgi:hypothetical protein